MVVVPMSIAGRRFNELARLVEAGEHVIVTRYGRPIFDMVPHGRQVPSTTRNG
jgi:antitoxin (DNA-binding transcriptional repressor) of toxin-antitoxin stability system